jgi:hypothetical protein
MVKTWNQFVPPAAGYTLYGHGTDEEKSEELNTYNSNESAVDCRHKLSQHLSRMKHMHIPQVTEWTHCDRRHVGQPRKRWNRPTAIKMEEIWNIIYPAAVDDDIYYPPRVLLCTPSVFQPKLCMFPTLVHSTVPTAGGSHWKWLINSSKQWTDIHYHMSPNLT